jgi:hypothetical protein
MNRKSTVAACLLAAAMLVGVTAATASAKQPDTGSPNFPPFSNLCVKFGGSYEGVADATGRPTTVTCNAAPSTLFSGKETSQLVNACVQVHDKYGFTSEFLLLSFGNIVRCDF